MHIGRKALLAGAAALAFTATSLTHVGTATAANSYCGGLAGSYDPQHPPQYQHVVVLMEENVSYNQFLATAQMPFFKQLAADCSSATNFHAATHPSQPNYMAATSGVATAVGARTGNDNVFHQVQASGRTWKLYAESMPRACYGSKSGVYKPGHTPAVWYTDLRSPTDTCAQNQVPMSPALDDAISADALPAYTWITPNECHDFYWVGGCPTAASAWMKQGDQWLSGLMPRLVAMPSYRAGRTVVLVTFDEGSKGGTYGVDCTAPSYYSGHPDCHIPTVAVSAYITPGTKDGSDQNLYSLLGTTEDILGLARLNRAAGQPSMRPGMRF